MHQTLSGEMMMQKVYDAQVQARTTSTAKPEAYQAWDKSLQGEKLLSPRQGMIFSPR
jgi:hypothetical protein